MSDEKICSHLSSEQCIYERVRARNIFIRSFRTIYVYFLLQTVSKENSKQHDLGTIVKFQVNSLMISLKCYILVKTMSPNLRESARSGSLSAFPVLRKFRKSTLFQHCIAMNFIFKFSLPKHAQACTLSSVYQRFEQ